MAGFDVEIDGLRRAGDAAACAGEQAATVDVAGALAGAGSGLPGSRSGPAISAAATTLDAEVRSVSRDAGELGRKLHSTADNYVAHDDAARSALSPWLLPGLGGP